MASKKKVKKTAPKKSATKKASTTTKKKTAKNSSKKAANKSSSLAKTTSAAKKKPAKKTAKKSATKKSATKKSATKKSATKKSAAKGARHEPSVFLLVHLPASMSPMERFERFEEPIDDALRVGDDEEGFGLGEVTGGGSSLDDAGNVVSCDIEVEVHDVARCLPILRRVLKESGAPTGTVVTRLAPDGAFEVLDQL